MLTAGSLVTANVRLVRPLGAGGMGKVWVAEHLGLHAEVVVKFLAESLVGDGDAVARFTREAAAASKVKSPHVVQMLDHGVTADGTPYIVMELLEGRDLAQHLEARGPLPVEDVREILTQLGRALEKAHQAGIVHRDVKPENIFLCDAGDGALFVKLLDFGIAKGAARLEGRGTATGHIIGSPFYMSPEQLTGARDIGPATDLWSVGVVVYELLAGARPFEADTIGALALKVHQESFPALPSGIALPGPLDGFFARACAKKPEERFARASELVEAFRAATGAEGVRSLPAPPQAPPSSPSSFAPTVGATTTGGSVALARTEATNPHTEIPRPRSLAPRLAAAAALVALIAGGGALYAHRAAPFPPQAPAAPPPSALPSSAASAAAPSAASASPAPPPLADLPPLPTVAAPPSSAALPKQAAGKPAAPSAAPPAGSARPHAPILF